jgi:hypothetical protein
MGWRVQVPLPHVLLLRQALAGVSHAVSQQMPSTQ